MHICNLDGEKVVDKGEKIYKLVQKIFPIFRCLMGTGVRETLNILANYIGHDEAISMKICNVESGTQVFDWIIPDEWIINEAYIEDESRKHLIDIKDNNLHVVGYSESIDKWVDLDDLLKYIYVEDEQPDVIPYVTSYYKRRYGFCMSKTQRDSLLKGKYHMVINSEFVKGYLSYGEVYIPGDSKKEVLISTYICHPSMANNECSGPAVTSELVLFVKALKKRKLSYRFLFVPETIGVMAYMSQNNHLEDLKKNVVAGFVLTCVGDDNNYSIVHTRYSNTLSDKVLVNVLQNRENVSEYSFLERGSDERQYNSPNIDLPIVTFCRSKFHNYPEYHTSADNLQYISPAGLQGSYDVMSDVIKVLEKNDYYNMKSIGEPQLSKRGLYPDLSKKGNSNSVKSIMDFLAYADGKNDLIDISNLIKVPCVELLSIVDLLQEHELIEKKGEKNLS